MSARVIALLMVFVILGCTSEQVEWAQPESDASQQLQVQPRPQCENECSLGLRKCFSKNVKMACGNFDDDPCLDLIKKQCPKNTICKYGDCVAEEKTEQAKVKETKSKPAVRTVKPINAESALPEAKPVQKAVDVTEPERKNLIRTACEELVPGENTKTAKLNLIFAGIGFDKNTIREKAKHFLFDTEFNQQTGLFTKQEPFKSLRNKFNLWLVSQPLTGTEYLDIREQLEGCGLNNWYGYVFVDTGSSLQRSYSNFGPNQATVVFATSAIPEDVGPAYHETGHLIGNLLDEYRGGRQQEPATYYHQPTATRANIFYDPSLDNDGFVSVQECRNNAQWKNWRGRGCGDENSVDCIDKYVFHGTYVIWDKPIDDPSKVDLEWGTFPDQYCALNDEQNCRIEINGRSVNPFNPGEGFVSVVKEGNVYRQEMFSHDILCKPEYGGGMPGMGECLNEVDCFVGGFYYDYNTYRSTFSSVMAGGPEFGPYNKYLIEQKINEVAT